jgi:murein DD-endopeptidase MepM/ murein hydrolase activator NlpD
LTRPTWCLIAGAALLAAACGRADPPPNAAFQRSAPAADVRLPREIDIIESTVPAHTTLDRLLRANQLREELVISAVDAVREVFDARRLRAGQPYRLVRTLDGVLREFEYAIDTDRFLRIVGKDGSTPPSVDAQVLSYEKQTAVAAIDARIDPARPSLIAAIEAAGETLPLAMDLADIFGGEVDFRTELQPGDSFRVLFEKATRDGVFCNYGAILGASISVAGRTLDAVRWLDPSTGKPAYYDAKGRSLKRFFLKSPLKFDPRITSRFSTRRLHPIDNVVKAHLGVDYAAPIGSAVIAVANGTVVSAGFSGGSGNMVHLKHADGFETYYLHLSAFAPGVRAGAHVSQGQLIGRVGMTGSATGPHLDYRIRKGGVFVNPVAAHSRQAPGEPVPSTELAAFSESRDQVLSRLSSTLSASAPKQKPDAVPAIRPK